MSTCAMFSLLEFTELPEDVFKRLAGQLSCNTQFLSENLMWVRLFDIEYILGINQVAYMYSELKFTKRSRSRMTQHGYFSFLKFCNFKLTDLKIFSIQAI